MEYQIHTKMKLLCLALAAVVSMPYAGQVAAQDLVLEEIVVTAQRRQESLQEVPISVSAFDEETLEKANISEAKDYLIMSPNVGFTEDGQTGSRSISVSIRGVASIALDTVANPSSIGYYVDELSVATTANGNVNPQLQDMQRIEVLRGSQGTYFGRNALGGAINITTQKPSQDFYAEATMNAGEFSTRGFEGIVNVPVSDTFMLRAMGGYEESEGPVENINPNSDNDTEFTTFRGAARWLPTDDITVDLSVTYTEEDEGGDIAIGSGVLDLDTRSIWGFGPHDSFLDGIDFYPDNDNKVNHDLVENNDNESTIINLRVSRDFENFTLRSITGLIDSEADRDFDQDNISGDIIRRHNRADAESFSQEFRLQSIGEGDLRWTVGVYYADDEINRFNSVQAGAEGTYTDPVTGVQTGLLPPIPAGFRINENNYVFDLESKAIFGEASWDLNENWSATAGARYTRDDVHTRAFGVVGFESPEPDNSGDESFSDFSPKLVVRYMPSTDLTVYASYSEGYKAGGVDINSGISKSFEEEQLSTFEVGFKAMLADGRVRLSGAIFSLDWEDLQVQTNFLADPTDISSGVTKTLNAADADSQGFELEMQALVSDGLTWSIALGHLAGEYGSFPNINLPGGNTADLSGLDLPKTPEWTLSTVLDYTRTIADSDLEGFGRFEWSYRDKAKGDYEGVAASQLGLPDFPYNIDSYDVANLRFGIRSDRWRVNAFIENLFDDAYYSGTSDNFGLAGIRVRPHPRVWGVSLTVMTGE